MNDLLSTNALNIITVICAIITAIFVLRTIVDIRADEKDMKVSSRKGASQTDEYDAILERTRDLEFDREKNKGQHFENETVYLKRANGIRVNTQFFTWIK